VPAKVNKSLVPRRWCPVGTKKKKKGQVRSWGGASRSSPRSAADPLRGSVGPSKAPLAYRPTSSRPSQQGRRSNSDRVPAMRGSKRKKKKGQVRSWGGASRSSPRSAADPQGIGRTELNPARLSSYVLPPLAAGPSIHLRSGSYAARGLSEWGCPGITLPLSGPTRLTHRA